MSGTIHAKQQRRSPDPGIRMLRTPTIVKGVEESRYTVLSPRQVEALQIDKEYQRERVAPMYRDLAFVLSKGGQIPSPIHVVQRKDGTRWIVDGQQRFWAAVDQGKELPAIIHRVKDMETERMLFVVLNNFIRVGPGFVIQAHPGVSSQMICEANDDDKHPLFERVNFGIRGATGTTGMIGAKAVLSGMMSAATGVIANGQAGRILERTDRSLKIPSAKKRAEVFLELAARCFDRVQPRNVFVIALGRVAYRRWNNAGDASLPTEAIMGNLRRTDWNKLCPVKQIGNLPKIEEEVEKRWSA